MTPTGSAESVVASGRVAVYLREAILRGDFRPGDRIRQEDVAERLGASRLPVREALRMLEAEGLVEHTPNVGARVPRLCAHEVDVIYRMRERLEPLALAESIPRLGVDEHLRLAQIQENIEKESDLDMFIQLDREFHLLTYAGCRVEPLASTVTRLWNSTQHYRRAFVVLGGRSRMWVFHSEHRLILDAIVRGDSADAERQVEGHIRRTRVELEQHPDLFS